VVVFYKYAAPMALRVGRRARSDAPYLALQKKGRLGRLQKKFFCTPEKGQNSQVTEALETLIETVVFSKKRDFWKKLSSVP
jgi:hypothetical protein